MNKKIVHVLDLLFENIFDNQFFKNTGDTVALSILTTLPLSKKLSFSLGVTQLLAFPDQKQEGDGSWATIPNSGTNALVGNLKLTYMPYVFTIFDIAYKPTLNHGATNGVYEFPGRFHTPGVVTFSGTILFPIKQK